VSKIIDKGMGKIETRPKKMVCEVGIEFLVESDEIPTINRILDMLGVNCRDFPFPNVRVVMIKPREIDGFEDFSQWRGSGGKN